MRRVLIACGGVLIVSCGHMNPTPKPLDLQAGRYLLIVSPSGTCNMPMFAPGVGVFVTLSRQGHDWVARTQAAVDGDIEFRFHEVVNPRVAGVAVDGTLVGTGNDRRPFAASGTSVSIAGASGSATVSAESTPDRTDWIAGRVDGQLTFNDGAGGSISCAAGDVTLRVPASCELNANTACP